MSQFSSLNIIIVFCCCTYFIFISVASCAAIYLLIRRDIWPWCLISTPSPHWQPQGCHMNAIISWWHIGIQGARGAKAASVINRGLEGYPARAFICNKP